MKEKSRIRVVQKDNIRGLLGIKKRYRMSSFRMKKTLMWSEHIEGTEVVGLLKRHTRRSVWEVVQLGNYEERRSYIDWMNDCLNKKRFR